MRHLARQLFDAGPQLGRHALQRDAGPVHKVDQHPRENRIRVLIVRPQRIQRRLIGRRRIDHIGPVRLAFDRHQTAQSPHPARRGRVERIVTAGVQNQQDHTGRRCVQLVDDLINRDGQAGQNEFLPRLYLWNIYWNQIVAPVNFHPMPRIIHRNNVARLDAR